MMTLGSSILHLFVFEGKDFKAWKKLMSVWLCGEGYYGKVFGIITKSDHKFFADDDVFQQVLNKWMEKDDIGVACIWLCLSRTIFMQADTERDPPLASRERFYKDLAKKKEKKVEEVNLVKEVSLVAEVGPIQIMEEHPSSCNLAEEKRTFTVDSGCTSIMVRSVDFLRDVKKAVGKVKLGGAASEIPVAGMENFPLLLIFGNAQHIPGALLVPNLCKDLLSVSKLKMHT
ncbi:hypothetical protein R1flu_019709 [Riccia fluitans]|uniref:Retrovirus-related Pol polyprotein from transposon TNT 1-94-like beta-barrel domain-containing protein n=1 Tax=Riccia fluitans TaxID=41844 RepID=A0ABD1ZL05_9MARC